MRKNNLSPGVLAAAGVTAVAGASRVRSLRLGGPPRARTPKRRAAQNQPFFFHVPLGFFFKNSAPYLSISVILPLLKNTVTLNRIRSPSTPLHPTTPPAFRTDVHVPPTPCFTSQRCQGSRRRPRRRRWARSEAWGCWWGCIGSR